MKNNIEEMQIENGSMEAYIKITTQSILRASARIFYNKEETGFAETENPVHPGNLKTHHSLSCLKYVIATRTQDEKRFVCKLLHPHAVCDVFFQPGILRTYIPLIRTYIHTVHLNASRGEGAKY